MQTFLPFPNFAESARVLDDKRLFKQVVECKQILTALRLKREQRKPNIKEFVAWANHPAVLMWEGHERKLKRYQFACIQEWIKRRFGYVVFAAHEDMDIHGMAPVGPEWLGSVEFHGKHRAILLAKNPEHYKQFGWKEEPATKNSRGQYPYLWPVQKSA
jgi:hypothetical protein